jgi:hypothetical protein
MINIETIKELSLSQILELFVDHGFNYTRNSQECKVLSDREFVINGITRIIEQFSSGRAFLQHKEDVDGDKLARSTFFDSFHSSRRLKMTQDVSCAFNDLIEALLKSYGVDYLSDFSEIDEYDVFAGDGHYIDHASHSGKDKKGKTYAAGTLYTQNLRTGLLSVLDVITDGHRKNHEMPIFRAAVETCTKSPRKTIWILDRAFVDKSWWPQQKSKDNFMIVRLKKSASLSVCGEYQYDSTEDVNTGVTRDYSAGMAGNGWAMRIVDYTDPETGSSYQFVTTLPLSIPPGLIAWLYLLRWKIEKSFDVLKNLLKEKKAWAAGKVALENQSLMITMTYNFQRFIKELINEEEDIQDTKVIKKYEKNLEKRDEKAKKRGRTLHPFVRLKNRMHRLSSQFIRVIHFSFWQAKRLSELIPLFRQRMEAYL